jgi:dipeptidyl aminopeptidase/acylaminoacyl peptidase
VLGLIFAGVVAAEDLFKLNLLGQAAIAPDGAHAVVVQKHMDGPKNTYYSTILLVDTNTGKTTDATGGKHDGDFAWAPDSKSFYFVRADKKKTSQFFRYTVATGAITQVSHSKVDVSSPTPSNDGKRIAYIVNDTDPAPNTYVDFAKAGFKPSKTEQKSDIRSIESLFYEGNGAGFTYDQHPHIWVMNADGSGMMQITSGKYGEGNQGWSYDDKLIVFNSTRTDSIDGSPNDIYTVSSSGGPLHKLEADVPNKGIAFVSRKADRLIYSASGVKDPAEYAALRWANFDGSNTTEFLPKNTISISDSLLADMKEGGGPCGDIMPDEKTALVNADGPGYSNLRILDLTNGSVRDLTPPSGEAFSCTLARDGKRTAFLYSDALHPADLFVADTATGKMRQLTHVNDAYLKTVKLSVPQPFTVKNPEGETVYAWFLPAIGGKPGEKHPTILDIHGGPETQFGDTFFMEFQYYAGLGYNIVYSNPRGSVGFGYQFEHELDLDYGHAMFEDVEAVMNQAVTRSDVDSNRLGVSGGSYGGYATLWVVSHTDRYKMAVAERVVSDLAAENADADFAGEGGLGGGIYGWGEPWDPNNTKYFDMSPINFVQNVHTPMLILHSELDTRTPLDQTVREYTLLKILGQKVKFVDVPGETHDLSRTGSPIHRVERLHILANWMNTYLHP